MASGEETIKTVVDSEPADDSGAPKPQLSEETPKAVIEAKLTEEALGDSSALKPPSSEEKLPKVDDSEPRVTPKAESEVREKSEDLDYKKSGESENEVARGCSLVTSEPKELSLEDKAKDPSEGIDKSTGDKTSIASGSLQSYEGQNEPYESAQNSLPSSNGDSDSYRSARSSPSSRGYSDGYVKVSFDGSIASLTSTPVVTLGNLEESLKVLSMSLKEASATENPSREENIEDESATSADKSVNAGEAVDGDDRKPLLESSVAEGCSEPSQKTKGAQSGMAKRFLGMSFYSKSADKPKKSSSSDKVKSPRNSDGKSEKPLSPKKPELPPKKPKSSRKSDGAEESVEKVKSPKKSDKSDEPQKKSKMCIWAEKVKSPKKLNGLEPSDKLTDSKKSNEQEESTTDSPSKLPSRKSFIQGVGSPLTKLFSRFSPSGSKRPVCSSTCDADLPVLSPALSPIDNGRLFSASYFGSFIPSDTAERIDFSKLAEERIIATFLTARECYDVMPISGKVIVLSVDLLVKNAFSALVTNEIKAAPLWDSGLHDFVGFLTITDFVNVLRHYYYSSPEDIKDIENQSISTWRRISNVPTRFIKINGSSSLSEATRLLIEEGVHRIPVFDERRQCVLFVLTRKRLLQYLSFHLFDKLEQFSIKTPTFFKKTLRELSVGTYENIATVTESTKVIDALDLFVERGVSSLPVVDEDGVLKDIFGKMDVFALAKEQMYHNLEITVYEVVRKGVPRECAIICTLDESLGTVIQRFISAKSHRIVVIDERRSVVGIISLSDLLKFLVLEPLAAMGRDAAAAGSTSDIIEEGAEGAVGGVDGDAVFNDDSENVAGESDANENVVVNSMKDLSVSKDTEEEPVTEEVSKSE